MFKILDLYIARTIMLTISLVLITFVSLSSIIKYIEQLRKVGDGTYDLLQALFFVALSIPRDLEIVFPMAALVGGLIGLSVLAENSELVVMQVVGFSKLSIGFSVLKTAVPLMIIVTLLGEWGAPQAQKMARDLRSIAISGGNLISFRIGVWARDSNDFIFMGKVENEKIYNLSMWCFDNEKNLELVIHSKEVNFITNNEWEMKNVQITDLRNSIEISKKILPTYRWKTSLSPDKLAVVTVKPEELSLSGLYDYIIYLEASEQDSSRYQLALWRKSIEPFSVAVMMLMAVSFIFGPLRGAAMGSRILYGVVAGFIFYICNEFFGPMSLVYGIPPVLGAITPSIVFLFTAVFFLQRKL
ncbi:lipopolysaccharide export system permease protein lptG [Candidatus Photodesmus blepharus]|uniref:Lipopolysaccharide export system permease protein lptG n=1 Tax=Candidatus Photodesmus blepharonis TaxID=1179155 RepID=A0A084CM09_9GAMM|nr:LPS export ABC transporter permease LptG [Candidatus Photodesmus blepharus]KEY90838.1 lipopolysaccharide export system permease protein lptG [Candidatus Photodesmus blepharus]